MSNSIFSAATLTLNPSLDKTMHFGNEFKAGALNRCNAPSSITPGSKGINVSRAWKKLGINSTACIFLGGENGQLMEKMLNEEGITFEKIATECETRMNIKMIDSLGVCTEANESGGPIQENELLNMVKTISKLSDKVEYFALGGSIPSGINKGIYSDLIKILKKKKCKVLLDCDGEALNLGLNEKPYLIKPNAYELSLLCNKNIDSVEDAITESNIINRETNVNVLCTLSEKGALWASDNSVWIVNSPENIKVKGFTGAGDTFLATFTYMMHKTGDCVKSLEFASSAAAAKVELEGSEIPDYQGMGKYIESVKAKKII